MSPVSDTAARFSADLVNLLPKVELHCHLEGAIRGESLLELVRQFDLDVPIRTRERLEEAIRSTQAQRALSSWRPLFNSLRRAFCTPEVITRLTVEVIEDYVAQNAWHVELRFSPLMMERWAGVATRDAISAVSDGLIEAQKRYGISAVGIVLVTRDATDPDDAVELARRAVEIGRQGRIVGFDIAGQEVGHPARRYAAAIDTARGGGLGLTIHAGEECGPTEIREAVELGADRIGHALSLMDDPTLCAEVIERGTTLEMCPTSNMLTGNWPDLGTHPATRLLRLGASVTLNADDPLVCGTDLTNEYRHALTLMGLTPPELASVVLHAARGAFLAPAERDALQSSLEVGLREIVQYQRGDQP